MKYRIREVTTGFSTRYYPERKILGLFWISVHSRDGWDSYWFMNKSRAYDVIEEDKSYRKRLAINKKVIIWDVE